MKCVKNSGATGGVNYGSSTDACPPRARRRLEKSQKKGGDRYDRDSRQSQAKKSLNTGSNKKTLSKGRIVKLDKPGLVERLRDKRAEKKEAKKETSEDTCHLDICDENYKGS